MNFGNRPTTGFARPIGDTTKPGKYDGKELAAAPARPCATDTREFPTRISNRLHYRDGRITDLAGNPINNTRSNA